MYNIGVILAGGTGKRVGGDLPKQLRRLSDGRTVLETCIDAFRACERIDEIIVVMHPDWTSQVPEGITVVAGGKERWESSWNAIKALSSLPSPQVPVNIFLHDCARPFVSIDILNRVCEALETNEAVTVAVPATDTIYVTGHSADRVLSLKDIPPRATMMRAQTPQAFRLEVIRRAYELALLDPNGVAATDDAGIVLKYLPDQPITIVPGSEQNKKLTFETDFAG